jgi:hypothetical protein
MATTNPIVDGLLHHKSIRKGSQGFASPRGRRAQFAARGFHLTADEEAER